MQRFSDGRWLIVESRAGRKMSDHKRNAAIYSTDLQRQSEFSVGDAVHGTIIDEADQIWVGYFDENPVGLKRFSETGDVEYDFNRSSDHDIFDLYAMTLGADGAIWVYPYTDFYLGRLTGDQHEIVLQQAPVNGAHAIAASGNHVAFFGSYDTDLVTLFDMRSQTTRTIELTLPNNKPGRPLIATQGDKVALLRDGQIFQFHMNDLIAAAT